MVGMQFFGRPHSGADDVRNLARLVCKMTRAGIELTINSEIDHFYKKTAEIASWVVRFRSHKTHFHTQQKHSHSHSLAENNKYINQSINVIISAAVINNQILIVFLILKSFLLSDCFHFIHETDPFNTIFSIDTKKEDKLDLKEKLMWFVTRFIRSVYIVLYMLVFSLLLLLSCFFTYIYTRTQTNVR